MISITPRQLAILECFKQSDILSFSDLFTILAENTSERTLKRDLAQLALNGILTTQGGGRSLVYTLPITGRFFIPIDADAYTIKEPDSRKAVLANYQFELWGFWPKTLFSNNELTNLRHCTESYQARVAAQSDDVRLRELERFIIELSWKSSRIEGNTYTLLDTELLLKEGIPSTKNTSEETAMILNHKTAFDFVLAQTAATNHQLTRGFIEQVHTLLMQGLITDMGMRKNGVGITGSRYRPLDNQFQIAEALDACIEQINGCQNGFDAALAALLGISYLQPFVDGNKRTARLITNSILLSHQLAPLSYRNVDEVHYRASLLAFYEQLSVIPMKQVFIDQYLFAAENYA